MGIKILKLEDTNYSYRDIVDLLHDAFHVAKEMGSGALVGTMTLNFPDAMNGKFGYWYMDCHGNYVLVKPKHDAHEVAKRLETEKKTLVHPYGNSMMKDMLRVTTGSRNDMEIFTKVFFEIDNA